MFFSIPCIEKIKELISDNSAFFPFRFLLNNPPLLHFIYHEKCRYIGELIEKRIVCDIDKESGKKEIVTGYISSDVGELERNAWHPGEFFPFELKGIWLPVNDGILYSTLKHLTDCPLIKKIDDREMVLFLIHPQSEEYYENLLSDQNHQVITVSALSLSSARTLLIALPTDNGHFEPIIVKLSLNQKHGGVLRILKRRDCAISVGNSEIFSRKLLNTELPFEIFEEPLAYLPNGYDAGMIYRKLPKCLQEKKGIYPVPLSSLLGVKNRDFLRKMISANGGTPSKFLSQFLFLSFANIYLSLLLDHKISIEAHSQNLLLLVDLEDRIRGFIYRDMAGVNQLLSQEELISLPFNLQDPSIYYFDTHIKDASKSLEHHFVVRVGFALTRQLVKDHLMYQNDPSFYQWYETMKEGDFLQNWTLENHNTEEYQNDLMIQQFYRYGYAEWMLMKSLFSIIEKRKILDTDSINEKKLEFIKQDNGIPPCSKKSFFTHLIREILNSLNN